MSRNNPPIKEWNLDSKVYVGDLGYGCAKQELEEKFGKYGHLHSVWVARKPPGFAFVEFEDSRDAEDAVRALDGSKINGKHVRVELSSGRSRWGMKGPPRSSSGRERSSSGSKYYSDYRGGGSSSSGSRKRDRSYSPRKRSRSRSFSHSPRRRSRSRS